MAFVKIRRSGPRAGCEVEDRRLKDDAMRRLAYESPAPVNGCQTLRLGSSSVFQAFSGDSPGQGKEREALLIGKRWRPRKVVLQSFRGFDFHRLRFSFCATLVLCLTFPEGRAATA